MLNIHTEYQTRWSITVLFFILLFSNCLCAESTFKVFQTQQPAQHLLPIIVPLYSQSAKFTANNNQLIVKASEDILLEIEQLLLKIDQPLQNLLIEVTTSLDNNSVQQSNSSGFNTSNSTIYNIQTGRKNSKNAPKLYKIRTVQGQWSTIQTGRKVPYYNTGMGIYNPWRSTSKLVDVKSGFDVFPIINGNQVIIKIRPHNNFIDAQYPNRINSGSLETSVTGSLGQWIFLGSAMNERNLQNNSNHLVYKNSDLKIRQYSTRRNSDLESSYSIRVNTID